MAQGTVTNIPELARRKKIYFFQWKDRKVQSKLIIPIDINVVNVVNKLKIHIHK